ncbi:MAG: flagellar hook-basal body complex protein FliE [Bdellovibrionaceae bacterium]|jgi:flagellar hook-basal body complex protein FliE|nr:flagellar hook-basal body complex protein FliE [Pseudobdellovibrionaceae bacterium]
MDGIKSLSKDFALSTISPSSSKNSEISDSSGFAKTLSESIAQVNELQQQADLKSQELATGKTEDIAGVMIAMEKADIALRLMMQVRNKLLESYQEIMKTQV